MELTLEEARQEWKQAKANGERMSFIEWLRWNGLDIDGSRYEYRTI